jgi:membrane protein
MRAASLYNEANAGRLAAACTYFGFLAIFPLLLLTFAVLGYVFQGSPAVTRTVSQALNENLPVLRVQDIQDSKGAAGIIGLAGFFLAGLGWVDVCRTSLRTLWKLAPAAGNLVVRKLVDAAVLVVLGLAAGLSLLVSALTSGAAATVLDWFGSQDSTGGRLVLAALGFVLGAVVSLVLFMVGLTALPRIRQPIRRLFWPSLLSAVGFEVLKTVGTVYVARTQANPAYQAVAVAAGLLVFLYLLHQLALFSAALGATDRSRPIVDLADGTQILPADRSQAASPETQAALLEAQAVPAESQTASPN